MKAKALWKQCGPGLVVAATGLGAGDIVAAAVAGAEFGSALLWAVLLGGLLKFVLNEGVGRWQLISGSTLLEGWIRYLPKFVSVYFMLYLLFWSFMVAAALMAATGLAAYALWPVLTVTQWGILHAVIAYIIVMTGAWHVLETLMKSFIVLMFCCIIVCAVLVLVDTPQVLLDILRPSIPKGSLASILSVMGGVGGSVTLLSYGYWIKEAGWKGKEKITVMRWDLGIAYGLTALFAMSVMLLSAGIKPEVVGGNNMALAVANQLLPFIGEAGKWIFLIGFWGAVFSSMLGVWHGVPYLFANFAQYYRQHHQVQGEAVVHSSVLDSDTSLTKSKDYRFYLLYLSFVPTLLLIQDKPVWIVVLYAITGAFFMPMLAALLLYLNGMRARLGEHINGLRIQALLIACLALFGYLLYRQLDQNLIDFMSR